MSNRQETLCLAVLLGVWFVVNLATLERSPTVWCDEVMFTDPAVHWVQGTGLTSTAWPQPPGTAAVLNGPLHTVLLSGWLEAWTLAGVGIGATVVRSLNCVLAAVAVVWLWGLARHFGVVLSPGLRLGAVVVLLCANGVSASYRSGRYDLTGVLVVLALVTAVSRRRGPGRGGTLDRREEPGGEPDGECQEMAPPTYVDALAALLGMLVPFAGLYLIPYCLLLAVGAVLCGGYEWIRRVAPALVGIAVGGVALLGMHLYLGTLPYFVAFTRVQSGTPLAIKAVAIPANVVSDYSVVPLLVFLAVCLLVHLRRKGKGNGRIAPAEGQMPNAEGRMADDEGRMPKAEGRMRVPLACLGRRVPLALLGLLAGIGIPVCMTLVGKYSRYYGWMAFVPVLAVVLTVLERGARSREQRGGEEGAADSETSDRRAEVAGRRPDAGHGPQAAAAGRSTGAGWILWLGVAALAVAMVVGLPLRLLLCGLEWQQRDYGKVSEFVRAHIRPGERVAADYSAYYPVSQVAGTWYLPEALGYVPRQDLDAITCIIDCPESDPWVTGLVGGTWQMTAEYRVERPAGRARLGAAALYHLAVYRRAKPGG